MWVGQLCLVQLLPGRCVSQGAASSAPHQHVCVWGTWVPSMHTKLMINGVYRLCSTNLGIDCCVDLFVLCHVQVVVLWRPACPSTWRTLQPAWAAASSWPLQSLQTRCWCCPRHSPSMQQRCGRLRAWLLLGTLQAGLWQPAHACCPGMQGIVTGFSVVWHSPASGQSMPHALARMTNPSVLLYCITHTLPAAAPCMHTLELCPHRTPRTWWPACVPSTTQLSRSLTRSTSASVAWTSSMAR
jgi:hypothetical protein